MAATADTQAVTQVRAPQQRGALDRAAGIELLGDVHGSGYKEGASLVRRADGQIVQIGPILYALLEAANGERKAAELAHALTQRFGRTFDELHVLRLAQKLASQGLIAGYEQHAPPRRNPLLALRWKVLVTNPEWTRRLTAPFGFLFKPFVMWPVLAAFVGVCWFVFIHKGVASATSQAFDKPGLLLLVFALAVLSAGFHEFGHAAATRYGGGTPGGMGMGIYMVWPAFYTDVTDAYRLPKRDRLRIDLAGLYFNALVAVVTTGVWLLWHADALLLLVALQVLQMVRQLSPIIRADGYHILSDATGVPDLYAHIGPTLKRLIPGHRDEPSALKGSARALVTIWVLVVVPVLLALLIGAVILLPRLLTTAWDSGRAIADGIGHEGVLGVLASCVRLVALLLPVAGSILVTQKIARNMTRKGLAWTQGRPVRRVLLFSTAGLALAGTAWALWPAGQYQRVRPTDNGTLMRFGTLLSSPVSYARPTPVAPAHAQLAPGTHLAVAMIPQGGATREHPAVFIIRGTNGDPPVAIVSDSSPDPSRAPTAAATTVPTTTTATTTTTGTTTTTATDQTPPPVTATAFPFKLPAAPGPGGNQALAVNTQNGGLRYDVAYALVTVSNGAPVTNTNGAFAFANCNSCTTVAVAFQIVLIVGTSKEIAPINAAGALNVNCPACLTTAIADQIVVTLTATPSPELLAKLQATLQQLNAIPLLGYNGTPAAVAAEVGAVQQQVDQELKDSGLLANTTSTTTSTTATTTTPTTTTATTTTSGAAATTMTTAAETTTAAQTTTTSTTTASTTTTAGATTTAPAATTTAPAATTTAPKAVTPTTTASTTTTTGETTTTAPETTTEATTTTG